MQIIRSGGQPLSNTVSNAAPTVIVKNLQIAQYITGTFFNVPVTNKSGFLNGVVPAGGATVIATIAANHFPVMRSFKISVVAAGLFYLRYNALIKVVMNLQAGLFYDIALNDLFDSNAGQNIDIFNTGGAGVQAYGSVLYAEVPQ